MQIFRMSSPVHKYETPNERVSSVCSAQILSSNGTKKLMRQEKSWDNLLWTTFGLGTHHSVKIF